MLASCPVVCVLCRIVVEPFTVLENRTRRRQIGAVRQAVKEIIDYALIDTSRLNQIIRKRKVSARNQPEPLTEALALPVSFLD